MSNIPISVCIIAKNEEKHIEECLKHLKPYDFEIIVTDTGSTDNTMEIAEKYADKVLDFEWTDDFSAARNYCAEYAENQWVLALDCDEYLAKADIKELCRLMKAYPKAIGALNIKNLFVREDGTTGYGGDMVPRLYNRKYFKFDKNIHEQIIAKYKAIDDTKHFQMPMEVIHYGYALSKEEMLRKQERNLKLLYNQLKAEGENSYIYFQIGQSEMALSHYGNAIEAYEKGLAFDEPRELIYVQNMIEGLGKAYVVTGRRQEAVDLMEMYAPECETAKFSYYHANILLDNNEPLKALIKYVKATMLPDTNTLGEELLYCYRHIIQLYHDFGEDALADIFKKRYEECLEEQKHILTE